MRKISWYKMTKAKQKYRIFILIILTFLFFDTNIFSQEHQCQIHVIEKDTKNPISFAGIVIFDIKQEKQSYAQTDFNGFVKLKLPALSEITISATGYKTLKDTINAGTETKFTFHLQQDVMHINEIVVTATRTEKRLKDAPVITRIITSKEIASKGINNIENVLATAVPGIQFQRHGTSKDVDVQGLGGRNILILIDGERLAGETRGNIDYDRINTADIERVEIVKGASSALYGSQAMGAVINIITKKYRQKVHAEITGQYKNFAEYNYKDISAEDPHAELKKNLDRPNMEHNMALGLNFKSWQAKTVIKLQNTDGYTLYDTDSLTKKYVNYDTIIHEARNIDPTGIEGSKQLSASQKINYRINKYLDIRMDVHYYNRHKYDFYKEDKKHDYYDAFGYGVKLNYKASKNTNAIFSFSSDIYNKYDYKERLFKADLNYKDKFLNPKAVVSHRIKRHELLLGAEFLRETLLTDMFVYGELIDKNNDTYTGFLQDEFKLNEKISAVAGLRAQYNTAFNFRLTPKASLMYRLKDWRIRANYAMGYRSPDLKELYMNWNHLNMFMIEGNANLRPETNQYLSLSTEYTRNNFHTSLTVFNNAFKDKIEGVWAENQTVYRFANISRATLYGCDVSAKLKLWRFIMSGAYSYVKEKNDENKVQLSALSPHSANFNAEYALNKTNYSLNVNFGARYIGAKQFYAEDELLVGKDTVNAFYPVSYKGYMICRLAVHQQFYKSIAVTAGVENLFNYKAPMITFNSYTGTGRLFFVKITLKFDKFLNKII